MTYDDWLTVMEVILDGTFNCTNSTYEDIKTADEGRLINISWIIGLQGTYGQANYAASKSTLLGFTRSPALELAPHGSSAKCVAPGYTHTDMVEQIAEKIQQRLRNRIPSGRFAVVEEIAGAVRYLASPAASYVTGETINVNGGMDL